MLEALKQRWDAVAPGQRKLITVMGLATALTAAGGLASWRVRGTMTPLYAGLSPVETREIAAELSRQGFDCKVSTDETTISVPAHTEPIARMKLAAAGMPRSAPEKGWEIFGEGGLAVTKPQQRALQIRALQGELARSIASLANVKKAAVHITLREDSPFIEQREPAKAAVLVHLKPGSRLTREQATAVAYLVARSVPDLETAQVTILDEKGNLLFSDNVASEGGGGDMTRNLEREIEQRVQSQLDITFGLGKTSVRATATLQTERSEVSRTTYKQPEGAQNGLAKKESSDAEDYIGAGAARAGGGVPGTGANLFGEAVKGGAGGVGSGSYTRRNIQKEYGINEEKEVKVKPGGGLQRLTLGIFVDQALQGELSKIETVARNAAGLDTQRGDSISVEAVKFAPTATDTFRNTSRLEMIKAILRLVLNSLALVIGLLTLRSIVAALRPVPEMPPSFGGDGEMALTETDLPLLTDQSLESGPPDEDARLIDTGVHAEEVTAGIRSLLAEPAPEPVAVAEAVLAKVESTPADDIAAVLRHWLEAEGDE